MNVLWLIQLITLLEMIPESTGFALQLTKEDSLEDLPLLVENTEDLESKDTEVTNKDQVLDRTGRGEIF